MRYFSGHDVTALALTKTEILGAVENSLPAPAMRAERAGVGVQVVVDYFAPLVAPLLLDRSPSPDIETLLEHFQAPAFIELTRQPV